MTQDAPTKEVLKQQKAAAKVEKAVAHYEAKAQKALEKAQAKGIVPELKERVIHTRVPAALDDKLKGHAERLRVPVSNLIRILLEDAMARPVELGRPDPGTSTPEVIGYQPFMPTLATTCFQCGRALSAGSSAFVALTEPPGARLVACADCTTPARGPPG